MLALKITDLKDFTRKLLTGDTFDAFCMVESDVTTFSSFSIDGKLHREFFDTDDCTILDENMLSYSLWKEIRPFFYSIIRGKRVPLSFKIVFCLPPKQVQDLVRGLHTDFSGDMISGLYLNIQFKNHILLCTSGLSLKTFSIDRSLEHSWDTFVLDFFRANNILYEKL